MEWNLNYYMKHREEVEAARKQNKHVTQCEKIDEEGSYTFHHKCHEPGCDYEIAITTNKETQKTTFFRIGHGDMLASHSGSWSALPDGALEIQFNAEIHTKEKRDEARMN